MNTNVNLDAALGVLAFLGTGFCLLLMGAIFLHALIVHKRNRAGKVLLMALIGVGLYAGLLLAFSFISGEKALAQNEEKHFCEIDCHLAYSVTNVERTKTIGSGANQATANGVFYVVTLKTRFDEKTISSQRGTEQLTPNSRVASITDEKGRRSAPSPEGTRALELSGEAGTPFTTALRPGESYTTRLAFDLPVETKDAQLLINEGELVTHFIIGHENSFLHKKTEFRLEPQTERTARFN
ncbi:MAG: DUF4352 domain-containing protein [Pyrinomonadaceae bacterium]|nr:DUF4352 domain-containing protein [Pyrinomonadaceae bacterium]